ncbi:MAG: MotA/TolQ/ExbB proton channel family protein [Zetaproteobacteria bacterium]|nr:MAG: MotA/TolQ/ExbB proton channel family protein [Zetaproteobacteria bacterium]
MIDFINQGGVVMYLLLIASILEVAIILERSWSLRPSLIISTDVLGRMEQAIRQGDVERAMQICGRHNTTMTRILWLALKNRGIKRSMLKERLEESGRQEVFYLERYLGILGVIAAIAPLLGLLGTVFGMIEVFQVISVHGVGKADVLAGGISKALNTTAAGLVVAIPALIAHRTFETRVNGFVVEIERHALRFVDLLKGDEPA